jgi:hypothetical protein
VLRLLTLADQQSRYFTFVKQLVMKLCKQRQFQEGRGHEWSWPPHSPLFSWCSILCGRPGQPLGNSCPSDLAPRSDNLGAATGCKIKTNLLRTVVRNEDMIFPTQSRFALWGLPIGNLMEIFANYCLFLRMPKLIFELLDLNNTKIKSIFFATTKEKIFLWTKILPASENAFLSKH